MSTGEIKAAARGPRYLRLLWLAPVLLAVAVFSTAPSNELVWDDPIVFERQVEAINSLRDVFIVPESVVDWSPDYYRPVIVLSYLLDLWLFQSAQLDWMGLSELQKSGVFISDKATPDTAFMDSEGAINRAQIAGLHIANVFYHALTSIFVWILAARLFARLPNGALTAVMVACVFAAHPIHVESVSWIAGRSDLLATLFLVPSVLLALIWRDTDARWALWLATLLYLLALMSKEVAISALIIVPAALLLAPAGPGPGAGQGASPQKFRADKIKWLILALLLVCATGIYFVLRQTDGVAYGLPLDVSWLNYLTRLEKSASYYMVKVVWPWPQTIFTGWNSAPGSLLSSFVLLASLVLAYCGTLLWRRDQNGLLLLALIWFAAALLPSLAVAMRSISITPLAERYLYLPSVGFVLMLGVAFSELAKRGWVKLAMPVAVLIVAGFSWSTVQRGMVWSSNLALWVDTTQKVPEFGDPWNQLGVAYLTERDYANAIEAFRRAAAAITGPEGRASANHNIAIIYQLRDDLVNAEKYYRAALDEQVINPEINYGLGVLYKTQSRNLKASAADPVRIESKLREAATQFEQTLRSNPYHALARWGLVSVLVLQGSYQEESQNPQRARQFYQRARQELGQLDAQNPGLANRADVRQARATAEAGLQRLRNSSAQ